MTVLFKAKVVTVVPVGAGNAPATPNTPVAALNVSAVGVGAPVVVNIPSTVPLIVYVPATTPVEVTVQPLFDLWLNTEVSVKEVIAVTPATSA